MTFLRDAYAALCKFKRRERPTGDELVSLGFLLLFFPIAAFFLVLVISMLITEPIVSIGMFWFLGSIALMVWGVSVD